MTTSIQARVSNVYTAVLSSLSSTPRTTVTTAIGTYVSAFLASSGTAADIDALVAQLLSVENNYVLSGANTPQVFESIESILQVAELSFRNDDDSADSDISTVVGTAGTDALREIVADDSATISTHTSLFGASNFGASGVWPSVNLAVGATSISGVGATNDLTSAIAGLNNDITTLEGFVDGVVTTSGGTKTVNTAIGDLTALSSTVLTGAHGTIVAALNAVGSATDTLNTHVLSSVNTSGGYKNVDAAIGDLTGLTSTVLTGAHGTVVAALNAVGSSTDTLNSHVLSSVTTRIGDRNVDTAIGDLTTTSGTTLFSTTPITVASGLKTIGDAIDARVTGQVTRYNDGEEDVAVNTAIGADLQTASGTTLGAHGPLTVIAGLKILGDAVDSIGVGPVNIGSGDESVTDAIGTTDITGVAPTISDAIGSVNIVAASLSAAIGGGSLSNFNITTITGAVGNIDIAAASLTEAIGTKTLNSNLAKDNIGSITVASIQNSILSGISSGSIGANPSPIQLATAIVNSIGAASPTATISDITTYIQSANAVNLKHDIGSTILSGLNSGRADQFADAVFSDIGVSSPLVSEGGLETAVENANTNSVRNALFNGGTGTIGVLSSTPTASDIGGAVQTGIIGSSGVTATATSTQVTNDILAVESTYIRNTIGSFSFGDSVFSAYPGSLGATITSTIGSTLGEGAVTSLALTNDIKASNAIYIATNVQTAIDAVSGGGFKAGDLAGAIVNSGIFASTVNSVAVSGLSDSTIVGQMTTDIKNANTVHIKDAMSSVDFGDDTNDLYPQTLAGSIIDAIYLTGSDLSSIATIKSRLTTDIQNADMVSFKSAIGAAVTGLSSTPVAADVATAVVSTGIANLNGGFTSEITPVASVAQLTADIWAVQSQIIKNTIAATSFISLTNDQYVSALATSVHNAINSTLADGVGLISQSTIETAITNSDLSDITDALKIAVGNGGITSISSLASAIALTIQSSGGRNDAEQYITLTATAANLASDIQTAGVVNLVSVITTSLSTSSIGSSPTKNQVAAVLYGIFSDVSALIFSDMQYDVTHSPLATGNLIRNAIISAVAGLTTTSSLGSAIVAAVNTSSPHITTLLMADYADGEITVTTQGDLLASLNEVTDHTSDEISSVIASSIVGGVDRNSVLGSPQAPAANIANDLAAANTVTILDEMTAISFASVANSARAATLATGINGAISAVASAINSSDLQNDIKAANVVSIKNALNAAISGLTAHPSAAQAADAIVNSVINGVLDSSGVTATATSTNMKFDIQAARAVHVASDITAITDANANTPGALTTAIITTEINTQNAVSPVTSDEFTGFINNADISRVTDLVDAAVDGLLSGTPVATDLANAVVNNIVQGTGIDSGAVTATATSTNLKYDIWAVDSVYVRNYINATSFVDISNANRPATLAASIVAAIDATNGDQVIASALQSDIIAANVVAFKSALQTGLSSESIGNKPTAATLATAIVNRIINGVLDSSGVTATATQANMMSDIQAVNTKAIRDAIAATDDSSANSASLLANLIVNTIDPNPASLSVDNLTTDIGSASADTIRDQMFMNVGDAYTNAADIAETIDEAIIGTTGISVGSLSSHLSADITSAESVDNVVTLTSAFGEVDFSALAPSVSVAFGTGSLNSTLAKDDLGFTVATEISAVKSSIVGKSTASALADAIVDGIVGGSFSSIATLALVHDIGASSNTKSAIQTAILGSTATDYNVFASDIVNAFQATGAVINASSLESDMIQGGASVSAIRTAIGSADITSASSFASGIISAIGGKFIEVAEDAFLADIASNNIANIITAITSSSATNATGFAGDIFTAISDATVLSADSIAAAITAGAASDDQVTLTSAIGPEDISNVGTSLTNAINALDGRIDSIELPENIGTSSLADGAVTTIKLADSAVTAVKITDGIITGGAAGSGVKIAASTITADNLATSSVTTAKILDGTIDTVDLADSAVTAAKVTDGIITGGAAGAGVKIAASTITADNLATGSVTTDKILDGTIAQVDLDATYGNGGATALGTLLGTTDFSSVDTSITAALSSMGGRVGSGVTFTYHTLYKCDNTGEVLETQISSADATHGGIFAALTDCATWAADQSSNHYYSTSSESCTNTSYLNAADAWVVCFSGVVTHSE